MRNRVLDCSDGGPEVLGTSKVLLPQSLRIPRSSGNFHGSPTAFSRRSCPTDHSDRASLIRGSSAGFMERRRSLSALSAGAAVLPPTRALGSAPGSGPPSSTRGQKSLGPSDGRCGRWRCYAGSACCAWHSCNRSRSERMDDPRGWRRRLEGRWRPPGPLCAGVCRAQAPSALGSAAFRSCRRRAPPSQLQTSEPSSSSDTASVGGHRRAGGQLAR